MPQRVLITGGASGLGRELALAFRARGDRVAVADINAERLAAMSEELGEGHLAFKLDVRDDADWAAALQAVEAEWQGLDVLVNNAGIATGGTMQDEDMAAWQRAVEINLLGVVRGCRAAISLLQASGGRILNIASMAGIIHPPMMGSYNAAKAGVVAYSETLALELDDLGVAVHVLCPGFFKTNLTESIPDSAGATKAVVQRFFDRATITAAEVAQAALRGMDKGEHLILTHPEGRQAHRLKRLFPETIYRRVMKKQMAGLVRANRRTK